jgi:hypothetical protein
VTPQLDLPQPSIAATTSAPSTQSTLVPTARSLYDLFTGGWGHRLTGLPTAFRGMLARSAEQVRSASADRHSPPGLDAAHR